MFNSIKIKDQITQIFAKLFDNFKLSNPIFASITLSLLVGLVTAISMDAIPIPDQYDEAVVFISSIIMALTGSRTTRYVKPVKTIENEK